MTKQKRGDEETISQSIPVSLELLAEDGDVIEAIVRQELAKCFEAELDKEFTRVLEGDNDSEPRGLFGLS